VLRTHHFYLFLTFIRKKYTCHKTGSASVRIRKFCHRTRSASIRIRKKNPANLDSRTDASTVRTSPVKS